MKKVSKLIKLVHSELSDCLAEFPAMMWVALFLDGLLILYMVLLGVDGILFPSRMTTLRMVIGGIRCRKCHILPNRRVYHM